MMRLQTLLLASASSLFLCVATAHAQDDESLPDLQVQCAPELVENRRATLEHEGDAGVWFHAEVARCMLGQLTALPLYAERVRLLEQRLTLSDERHVLMLRQVALAEEGEQAAVSALEAAERGRRQAVEEASFERALRWVWFGVGVVVVVAVEALAIWIFNEVRL